jgi:hypothetical protein
VADIKVVWQAKNISGGLPISGGFLEDLSDSAQAYFCLADSGGFRVLQKKLKKKNILPGPLLR